MKTVLTIDFDIIMAPTIEFYNHFPLGNRWEILRGPFPDIFYGDYVHYEKLTFWLMEIFKKLPRERLHFIISHDKLINYLDMNEQYNIINIDHHHDIQYPNPLGEKEPLNCGNWVQYLYNNNCLNSYQWIKNVNSCPPVPEIEDKIEFQYDTQNLNNFQLDNFNPDMLIICLSPEWIPPNIQPLFQNWINMASYRYNEKLEIE